MKADITLDVKEFNKRLEEVLRKFPEAGEKCMEKACLVVESKAKHNAPVDYGTLRSSITHKTVKTSQGVEGYVYTKEEYAPHVEFGTGIYAENGKGRQATWKYQDKDGNWYTTKGQSPKKFLSNAMVSERDKIIKEFRRLLDHV